jgi:predicted neutral ceramidase superfamily lipid hydrolase
MIKVKDIRVLGAQKATELVSTINSIIATMKIAAPLIFGLSLLFSLLGLLFVPW